MTSLRKTTAALVLLGALWPGAVLADYAVKDGNGTLQTFGSFDVAGVKLTKHVLVDPTGAAFGTSALPIFVQVANFPSSQAVTATSLPLPTGAATSAAQGTGNASLASIDTKLPALVSGRVPVDGSGVTQPVSAAALPLPAGAATAAAQASANSALGAPTDAAWDGSASSASITSILKGLPRTSGTGGSSGSVTAAGTSGTTAQAVQGITNGVPFPVAGAVAVGSAPVNPPLSISGVDGSGLKRHVLLDADGTTVSRVRASGLGALTAVPTASANGTALGTIPATARGARLYVSPGGSMTFTIAATCPSSPPTATLTVANPSTATTPINWDEDLNGQMVCVTAGSGLFRWY